MEFIIGTVVSLKSNGLLLLSNHHFLSLGGNENFTTPLMIVIEILYNTSPEIDEETGEIKSNQKGGHKYKCMYFSNKTMKFEENWFSEKELEIYGNDNHEIHTKLSFSELKWGDTVRFKTVDEEARKTKSYAENEKQKGAKPLLTFTSPAMQIIGFANTDKKEPLIDAHTGLKKRSKPERLVKCKFFNTEADKFSEQLVPIECLQKIDNSKIEDLLNQISSFIKNKDLILIKEITKVPEVYKKSFGRPITVHVISGRYQLVFWNELLKKNELIWLDLVEDLREIDVNKDSGYYPGLHEIDGEDKVVDVLNYIELNTADIKDSNFKIVYRNLKDQVISRYIQIKKVSNPAKNEDGSKSIYYLNSYCFYREAEREFRSDRVLSIRTIENEQLNNFLDEI